jgi:hypothetical protein
VWMTSVLSHFQSVLPLIAAIICCSILRMRQERKGLEGVEGAVPSTSLRYTETGSRAGLVDTLTNRPPAAAILNKKE